MRPCTTLRARFTATIFACFLLSATLLGCSDRGDDRSQPSSEHDLTEEDAGTDISEQLAESAVPFDQAIPAEPSRTIVSPAHRRGVIANNPPLAAENFLSPEESKALLGDTELEISKIAGQPPSSTYNSIRYAPAEHPDQFGLGLQIWHLDGTSPAERLTKLRGQFLNVARADHKDAPRTSFISERAGIRTFVFSSKDDSHLFALSCGLETCPDWPPLYDLGLKIANRD